MGMTLAELEALSKAELIELVLKLMGQVATLSEKLSQPAATPANSSVPPSQGVKSNLPPDRPRQKMGPKVGHPKFERAWVTTPDEIKELRPSRCDHCQTDLAGVAGQLVATTQITELPLVKAQVIEVRQYEVICPDCGVAHQEAAPAGLELNRTFGSRLEATVVYYRQEQHLSYERTQEVMAELHGVNLSEGAIDLIMQRVGQAAESNVADLAETVRQSSVVHSDETSARVEGRKWWQWVFCTATVVLHLLKPSRGAKVVLELVGDKHTIQVWVSDCLAAQMKTACPHHQICLAHQLRDLQRVVEKEPHCWWAAALQALLRRAIHLHHQRTELSPEQWQQERQRLNRILDWLLKRPLQLAAAKRLQNRYRKYRPHLLLFLEVDGVEPTNNVAERALRPSVIHRKVTYGFRSQWGARTYAALASVIDTAQLKGVSPFQAILALLPPSPLTTKTSGE